LEGSGAVCPLQKIDAMNHMSLKEFTTVGQQLRWLTRLAFWLVASHGLRLWADDLRQEMASTRR
jgi:hypothetical protein